MYVLYIIQRFVFNLTKSAKTHGQKLEHWQNYNNSNGKIALKHIVPFPTENDDCRISSSCSRTMTMIFHLFSTSRLSQRKKIYRKNYYIVIFHLSSCVVYAENFQNIFSIHKNVFVLPGNQNIKDVHKVNGGHFLNSTIAESKYETYCLAKTICQFRHVGFPTHFNTRWNT